MKRVHTFIPFLLISLYAGTAGGCGLLGLFGSRGNLVQRDVAFPQQNAASQKRLGALLGITAVLHTWTRDLRFHPHLHCVVTGGGLALDADRWVDSGGRYLFPVKVISALFRGKFIALLKKAHQPQPHHQHTAPRASP